MPDRAKVLVLGGGFGGVGAVKKLKHADADVVVVDKHDYHTFQPLLYQVATDLIETTTVGHQLRDLFRDHDNVAVHEATVSGLDLENRTVSFEEMGSQSYDHLVIGLGAVVNFFGVPGADEHAYPMYTLPDAVRLRRHILERWEATDRDPSLADDGALNVVVVGAGPTGVESAGAIAELYRSNFAKDFPNLPQAKARVIMIEGGDAVLSMFKKGLQTYAKRALEKLGVEVRLGEVVEKIEPTRVHLKSGDTIDAHTLVWGAGMQANPLASDLGVELQRGGRVPTELDLSLAGHPEVFVTGDIAWITDAKTKKVLPQLGSVALQAGERAGENIARRLEGKDTEPFKYLDKGTMATIGPKAAVVQMPRGRSLTGRTAWLSWGAVHLALLSTDEARARALLDWVWGIFTHERAGRIMVDGADE
jgi:NADH:quinone reductase (non-electrogenic)